MNIRHIDDLKSDRTSLTVVPGVGDATAKKLKSGGIITVMMLSMCNPIKLVALGIKSSIAKSVVKAAEKLVSDISPVGEKVAAKAPPLQTTTIRTVKLNGVEIQISEQDFERAQVIGVGIEEYMHWDAETQAREWRIASSKVTVDAPEIDHTVFDFDEKEPLSAPDFVQKRRRNEISTQNKNQINRDKTFKETASFVQNNVHGENIDGMGHINTLVKDVNMNPTQEELDTEVYIPNRRVTETRLEAKKAQSDSVKSLIDNILD